MEIVILLIPLALLLVGIAIRIFFWAVRNQQFDDLDSPQWQIIFDDRENQPAAEQSDATAPDQQESGQPRQGSDP